MSHYPDMFLDADTFERVVCFVYVARALKDEIKLGFNRALDRAPPTIPSHIQYLLSELCSLSNEEFSAWWDSLKEIIWFKKDASFIGRSLTGNEKMLLQVFAPTIGLDQGKKIAEMLSTSMLPVLSSLSRQSKDS